MPVNVVAPQGLAGKFSATAPVSIPLRLSVKIIFVASKSVELFCMVNLKVANSPGITEASKNSFEKVRVLINRSSVAGGPVTIWSLTVAVMSLVILLALPRGAFAGTCSGTTKLQV